MTARDCIEINMPLTLPIVIPDDTGAVFDPNNHVYPREYEGHFESCMITAAEIRQVVKELAIQVQADLKGHRPVVICTLKGACPFFSHFLEAFQEMRQGYDVEFVRASSYEGTNTTGTVKMMGEIKVDALVGRRVLVIEDIVDTGTTFSKLLPLLQNLGKPAWAEVVTLLDKRLDSGTKKFQAKYVGFSIPNRFTIGYGLDYNELYRDLKDIFVISKVGIDFDRKTLTL